MEREVKYDVDKSDLILVQLKELANTDCSQDSNHNYTIPSILR